MDRRLFQSPRRLSLVERSERKLLISDVSEPAFPIDLVSCYYQESKSASAFEEIPLCRNHSRTNTCDPNEAPLSAIGSQRSNSRRDSLSRNHRTGTSNPKQVAKEYNIPVEAVLEAIHYCNHNKELLDAERAREQANIEARGLNRWPHAPQGQSEPDESLPG
jgi:hypothetical protein